MMSSLRFTPCSSGEGVRCWTGNWQLATALLVPQRLNRIQPRRPHRRHHPAHHPHHRQDSRRHHQNHRRNNQPNVSHLRIFRHRAIKRQPPHPHRHHIRQQDPQHSSHRRNHHRLRQKLHQNIPPPIPHRPFLTTL